MKLKSYEIEKDHLLKVMDIHKKLCDNTTPKGMYIGSITNNTKKILYEYNSEINNKNSKISFSDLSHDHTSKQITASFTRNLQSIFQHFN